MSCRISVYYEDTDLSGVVYHANYLRYMERGRTEFFRLAGISKMAGLDERRTHRLGDALCPCGLSAPRAAGRHHPCPQPC